MKIEQKENKISFILTLAAMVFIAPSVAAPTLFAAEQPRNVGANESLILAPEGLQPKEQAELEKQYRYTFKDKGKLLSPFISSEGAGSISDEALSAAKDEAEKLHRYFGAAAALYREGRLDEAIEILRYIVDRDPEDSYVKGYLDRVLSEKNAWKQGWDKKTASNARLLKNTEIKALLKDGSDYYKQKRFDDALLKFSEALSIDPSNKEAASYVAKLREYYMKGVRIEGIVEKYETESEAKAEGGATPVDKLLNAREGDVSNAAERLLDEKEFGLFVKEKKLEGFMNQAELGLTVDDIITQRQKEDARASVYTLGAGDTIQISVRDHPELSGKAVIRLTGEVVLPLVNDVVKVKGLTVEEATEKVRGALVRYVKDPFVTITIEEYKSKTFYVIDEIGCTPYPVTRANLTLRDALFVADWGDDRALGRVIVMKPHKTHPIIRKIDAFDIIYRGNLVNNIKIDDGDVIYIPMTIAAKVTKTLADSLMPFSTIRQVRDEWLNLKYHGKGQESLFRMPKDREQQIEYNPATVSSISSTGV